MSEFWSKAGNQQFVRMRSTNLTKTDQSNWRDIGQSSSRNALPSLVCLRYDPLASQGWVTSGAVKNWGCHPSVFPETPGDLFSRLFCGVILCFSSLLLKTWRPFFAHRCHYHYRLLLLSLGCHPLEGVTRGSPPPLVTPLLWSNSRRSTLAVARDF